MVQIIPLKEMRAQLSEVVSRVTYGRSQVVITRFGKPKVAIINYEDYERLMNPRARFTQEEWDKGFLVFGRVRKKIRGKNSRKLPKVIERAVFKVRKERSGQSGC